LLEPEIDISQLDAERISDPIPPPSSNETLLFASLDFTEPQLVDGGRNRRIQQQAENPDYMPRYNLRHFPFIDPVLAPIRETLLDPQMLVSRTPSTSEHPIGYELYTCITTRMSSTGRVDCLMGHVRGSLAAARASVSQSQGPLTHAVIFGFDASARHITITPLLQAGNFASTQNTMDLTPIDNSRGLDLTSLYIYIRATFPRIVRYAVIDKLVAIKQDFENILLQGRRPTTAYSSSEIPVIYRLH
jgi:hypothetical protein